ncbi:MAG: SDR family NAD(P)-dependent oxidoreductase, partial [Kiritimatiellota bacterium]|nr:SDR family NAD(P)-dependent oxidoreductase [Kiritimatiellota bacterium]
MDSPPNIARLLTILRGLLAEPSRHPDDPWQRVIFKPCAPSSGSSGGVAIDLKGVVSKAADDELRKQLRGILSRTTVPIPTSQRVGKVGIIVPGGSAYYIERGAVSAQAPLQNEIALVTGAAGAIGAGICRGLLAQGAHVAASDLAKEALDDLVQEL